MNNRIVSLHEDEIKIYFLQIYPNHRETSAMRGMLAMSRRTAEEDRLQSHTRSHILAEFFTSICRGQASKRVSGAGIPARQRSVRASSWQKHSSLCRITFAMRLIIGYIAT